MCPDNVGWELSGEDSESRESYDEEDERAFFDDFIRGEGDEHSTLGAEWKIIDSDGDKETHGDYDDDDTSNDDGKYEIIGNGSCSGSDGDDDEVYFSADKLLTEKINVSIPITSQKTLRAAAKPWLPSSATVVSTVPTLHVETSVKVTMANDFSKPLRANAAPWFPLINQSRSPPPEVKSMSACDKFSLVANMFKWNKLETLRHTSLDGKNSARCHTAFPAGKRKSQECFCGMKVFVGTCCHYGTNYGRRSLVCTNGICRFMEVLPGNNYGFEEPPAPVSSPHKQTRTFPHKSALPKTTHDRKTSHRYDSSANQHPTLATCIKTPVINVIARPLDESPAALVEKTWAIQILDGPEDVLQMARLQKVLKKVRTRRARQRSGGSRAIEKPLSCKQLKARPFIKISVRVGLSGLERRRLAKRKREKRPHTH